MIFIKISKIIMGLLKEKSICILEIGLSAAPLNISKISRLILFFYWVFINFGVTELISK